MARKFKKGDWVAVAGHSKNGEILSIDELANEAEIKLSDGTIIIEKLDLLVRILLVVKDLWPLIKQFLSGLFKK